MTTLEISYEADLRKITLAEGSIIRRNNDPEFIVNAFYDEGRLVRFWAARRNGKEIRESHYSINSETGIPHLDLVGGVKTGERHAELNAMLEEFEK